MIQYGPCADWKMYWLHLWSKNNTVQWHLQHTGLVLHKAGGIGVGYNAELPPSCFIWPYNTDDHWLTTNLTKNKAYVPIIKPFPKRVHLFSSLHGFERKWLVWKIPLAQVNTNPMLLNLSGVVNGCILQDKERLLGRTPVLVVPVSFKGGGDVETSN